MEELVTVFNHNNTYLCYRNPHYSNLHCDKNMKFYNRETEVQKLQQIALQAQTYAQLTVVLGRRRIGKTSLLLHAYQAHTPLYFFVAKKNEYLLCAEFVDEVKVKLNIPIYGEFRTFKDLFGLLMEVSKTQHFTLIIDEFQDFSTVNAAIFSEMQKIWDMNKNESRMNLIVCGSVYSLMTRIFENVKEPLFGRASHRLHIKAFHILTLKTILQDAYPEYQGEDLLALYIFTGGVAKYVVLLIQSKSFTKKAMIESIFAENSLFIEEGKNVLIDEFGKDYMNYFSILSLIASGKTSRVEIESILQIQTGGFLDRLETEFGLIKKVRPIYAKPNGRKLKYAIEDNFLSFWFRFIYKYRSAVEAGNLDYIKQILERDYSVYSGKILEKFFREKLIAEKAYSEVGTFWDKSGENEIDIVAVNDLTQKALIVEVKRNDQKIDMNLLKKKSAALMPHLEGYEIEYAGWSIQETLFDPKMGYS